MEGIEIIGLDEGIGEFGVGDAGVRLEAVGDDLLVEEGVHSEELADFSHKQEDIHI